MEASKKVTSMPIGGQTFFSVVMKSIAFPESLLVNTSNQLCIGTAVMTCSLTIILLQSASKPEFVVLSLKSIFSGGRALAVVSRIVGCKERPHDDSSSLAYIV